MYGFGYQGSKNSIAKKIIDSLPPADHFYDLFGGGGAISHCALLSGKYKYIHYNELDPLAYKAFDMAVKGEFKNENRWISREEFNKLKNTDPYVAICFSFGNNPKKGYCYAKDIEHIKKALHYAICYQDFSLLELMNIHIKNSVKGRNNVINTMKEIVKVLPISNAYGRLQSMERLERLQRLADVDTSNVIVTNKSYNDVEIENNSVVYCDPPYINTSKYNEQFNHDEFYEWCRTQKNVYISEYTMPSDFKTVLEINKTCCMGTNNNKATIEKLFTFERI